MWLLQFLVQYVMKPKFEGVLHMFGVDAKVSPGVVLPGLQGDWPLLL